jgi:hypothetical protein
VTSTITSDSTRIRPTPASEQPKPREFFESPLISFLRRANCSRGIGSDTRGAGAKPGAPHRHRRVCNRHGDVADLFVLRPSRALRACL